MSDSFDDYVTNTHGGRAYRRAEVSRQTSLPDNKSLRYELVKSFSLAQIEDVSPEGEVVIEREADRLLALIKARLEREAENMGNGYDVIRIEKISEVLGDEK